MLPPRKRQWICLEPGVTGEVRFVARLFGVRLKVEAASRCSNSAQPNATEPTGVLPS